MPINHRDSGMVNTAAQTVGVLIKVAVHNGQLVSPDYIPAKSVIRRGRVKFENLAENTFLSVFSRDGSFFADYFYLSFGSGNDSLGRQYIWRRHRFL